MLLLCHRCLSGRFLSQGNSPGGGWASVIWMTALDSDSVVYRFTFAHSGEMQCVRSIDFGPKTSKEYGICLLKANEKSLKKQFAFKKQKEHSICFLKANGEQLSSLFASICFLKANATFLLPFSQEAKRDSKWNEECILYWCWVFKKVDHARHDQEPLVASRRNEQNR